MSDEIVTVHNLWWLSEGGARTVTVTKEELLKEFPMENVPLNRANAARLRDSLTEMLDG